MTEPDDQTISAPPDLRRWRIEIPNLYDDAGLSPFEFRLLVHYVRVGKCVESVRTTAKKTGMSPAMVVKTRDGLKTAGFITIDDEPSDYNTIVIAVVDKWEENFAMFSNRKRSRGEQGVHVVNGDVHTVNGGVHGVNQRINNLKKKPVKKKTVGEKTPKPETKIVITNELRKQVEEYFTEKTDLQPLPGDTQRIRGQNSARWYAPIRTLCEMGEGDFERTKKIIDGCFGLLDRKYIYAPQSIMNVAPRALAELPTNAARKSNGIPPELTESIRALWDTMPGEYKQFVIDNPGQVTPELIDEIQKATS